MVPSVLNKAYEEFWPQLTIGRNGHTSTLQPNVMVLVGWYLASNGGYLEGAKKSLINPGQPHTKLVQAL